MTEIYDKVKKYVLWPILVPMLALILIDYARAIGTYLQIGIAAYMMLWWLSGVVGIWAGLMCWMNDKSKWLDLFDYRFAKLMPAIGWGFDLVYWMLEDVSGKEDGGTVHGDIRERGKEPRDGDGHHGGDTDSEGVDSSRGGTTDGSDSPSTVGDEVVGGREDGPPEENNS